MLSMRTSQMITGSNYSARLKHHKSRRTAYQIAGYRATLRTRRAASMRPESPLGPPGSGVPLDLSTNPASGIYIPCARTIPATTPRAHCIGEGFRMSGSMHHASSGVGQYVKHAPSSQLDETQLSIQSIPKQLRAHHDRVDSATLLFLF